MKERTKLQVAHLKLSQSRAFSIRACPLRTHVMLFDAHTRAFAVLGGIPKRGIYDNMRTAVDKIRVGKARDASCALGSHGQSLLFRGRILQSCLRLG